MTGSRSEAPAGQARSRASRGRRARRGHRGIGADARMMAVITAAARVAGFVRTVVFAGTVGATVVGEAYQSTNTVPNVIFEVAAGGVLAAATVPLLAGRLGRGDREGADAIASALLTRIVVVLVPLAVVIALAAPSIARALLGDAGAESVRLGARMLVVFAPQVVLYGAGIILSGVLQSHQRFAAVALAPLLSSLVVIATYVAYGLMSGSGAISDAAIWVLAGGTTLGVAALSLPLIAPVRAAGVRLRPQWRFPEGVARRVLSLGGAGLLALAAQQLAVLATVWLANNRAPLGTINVYQYVQAIYLLPYAVLAVPVATAAFPVLASNDGQGAAAAATLARSGAAIVVLSGLSGAVLIAAAPDLGGVVGAFDRGRGGGGAASLATLPAALTAYAPGLVGLGLIGLFTRALYVRGRPSRAAGAAGAGWLLAAVVPVLVLTQGGDRGALSVLGAASTAGMSLAALALSLLVRRTWGPAAVAGLLRSVAGALACLLAGVGTRVLLPRMWAAPGDQLVGSVVHGMVAAAVAALLAGVLLRATGAVGGRGLPVAGPR